MQDPDFFLFLGGSDLNPDKKQLDPQPWIQQEISSNTHTEALRIKALNAIE